MCKISNGFSSICGALSHIILKSFIKITFNSCIVLHHMDMLQFIWSSATDGNFTMFLISSYYRWMRWSAHRTAPRPRVSRNGASESECAAAGVLALAQAWPREVAGCLCSVVERWPHPGTQESPSPGLRSLPPRPAGPPGLPAAAEAHPLRLPPSLSSARFFINLPKSWELKQTHDPHWIPPSLLSPPSRCCLNKQYWI